MKNTPHPLQALFLTITLIVFSFVLEYAIARTGNREMAKTISGSVFAFLAYLSARHVGVIAQKSRPTRAAWPQWCAVLFLVYLTEVGVAVLGVAVQGASTPPGALQKLCNPSSISPSTAFVSCILSPLFEEFIFVGFLYASIRQRYPRWIIFPAIAVALVFSLAHAPGTVHAAIPRVVSMLASCLLFDAIGNIFPALIIHITFNTTVIFMDQFSGSLCHFTTTGKSAAILSFALFVILAVLVILCVHTKAIDHPKTID